MKRPKQTEQNQRLARESLARAIAFHNEYISRIPEIYAEPLAGQMIDAGLEYVERLRRDYDFNTAGPRR